jgi:hypothetical protein
MLRSALGYHLLDNLEADLSRLPTTSPLQNVAFVRAARLYQESVWLCESQPAIAWLLTVSAAECVADTFSKTKASPLDRLRSSKPKLAEIIEHRCPDLLDEVAKEIADSVGATGKFLKFLLHFLPDAPARRPPSAFQVPWSGLRPILSKIYSHRSKALHAGTPFPAPMCIPPGSMMPD